MHRVELLVFGFVFAPKVPSMGSLGREPEVLWDPYHFSLWRRLFGVGGKAGVCGFAAWGNFVGGLPPFRWPLPWPLPIAALLGRGIRSALLRGGILLAACRHYVGLSPGPSPSLRFWGGEFGRLCCVGEFWWRLAAISLASPLAPPHRCAFGEGNSVGFAFWLGFVFASDVNLETG